VGQAGQALEAERSDREAVRDADRDQCKDAELLSLAAQEHLGEAPRSGALFVFVNKRHNRLKVLWLDRNGYCLLYKRLHRAKFRLPDARTIDARTLGWILRGVENAPRVRVGS
jgi:transposase